LRPDADGRLPVAGPPARPHGPTPEPRQDPRPHLIDTAVPGAGQTETVKWPPDGHPGRSTHGPGAPSPQGASPRAAAVREPARSGHQAVVADRTENVTSGFEGAVDVLGRVGAGDVVALECEGQHEEPAVGHAAVEGHVGSVVVPHEIAVAADR